MVFHKTNIWFENVLFYGYYSHVLFNISSFYFLGYDYDDLDIVCGLARGNSGWGAPHSFLPPAIRYGIHPYQLITFTPKSYNDMFIFQKQLLHYSLYILSLFRTRSRVLSCLYIYSLLFFLFLSHHRIYLSDSCRTLFTFVIYLSALLPTFLPSSLPSTSHLPFPFILPILPRFLSSFLTTFNSSHLTLPSVLFIFFLPLLSFSVTRTLSQPGFDPK